MPTWAADGSLSRDAVRRCRATLETHSKSFALAARVLPASARDEAAVVYAWCRHVDDAVDEVPGHEAAASLARLRKELDAVYAPVASSCDDITLLAFREVVRERSIPRLYPEEMLAGMAMDVEGTAYPDRHSLLRYCHRVAGVVGLMMCHVLGVRRDAALRHAAHLGWGMQLTNICRDVLEDWARGRLYLPDDLLRAAGVPDLRTRLGGPFPAEAAGPVAEVVQGLLAEAEKYYRSGDTGLRALDPRSAFAVRTARLVYSAIGSEIAQQRYDVRRGRAFVPTPAKLWLLGKAFAEVAGGLPVRAARRTLGDSRASWRAPAALLRFDDLTS